MKMNIPDRYVDADSPAAESKSNEDACEWVVRLERRDRECRYYFIDRGGNVNARLSSAMLMTKDDARQYAKAITDQHPMYKARAFLYETMGNRK